MNFLLYSKGTSTTGRALAERLEIRGGIEPPEKPLKVLIRWGSTVSLPFKAKTVVNKLKNVRLATDKLASLGLMRGAGISVPEILTLVQAESLKKLANPLLGRKLHHTQGRDLILCLQMKDVRRILNRGESDYFVSYIPTKREYRVHVFNGKIIRVSQKLLKDGEDWVPFVRNYENGYIYGTPKKELRPEQGQMAINAVKTLGLDFGAVDLIHSDDDKSYVLEVNTGPALIENGLDIYAEEFQKILNVGIPNSPALY
jgi:glutathione synthase/RimK-type ligase-like ATP-grasp enzyme